MRPCGRRDGPHATRAAVSPLATSLLMAGKIVPARGPPDFGWDPVFEPDCSEGLTYAEMTKADKTAISHRTLSLIKLHEWLVANAGSLKSAKAARGE